MPLTEQQVLQDPEFQGLPKAERDKVLARVRSAVTAPAPAAPKLFGAEGGGGSVPGQGARAVTSLFAGGDAPIGPSDLAHGILQTLSMEQRPNEPTDEERIGRIPPQERQAAGERMLAPPGLGDVLGGLAMTPAGLVSALPLAGRAGSGIAAKLLGSARGIPASGPMEVATPAAGPIENQLAQKLAALGARGITPKTIGNATLGDIARAGAAGAGRTTAAAAEAAPQIKDLNELFSDWATRKGVSVLDALSAVSPKARIAKKLVEMFAQSIGGE